jgi:hypothetical protein
MYNEETTSTKDEALKPDLFMQDFKFYKKLQTIDFSRPIESILYLDKINEEALKKFNLKVLKFELKINKITSPYLLSKIL